MIDRGRPFALMQLDLDYFKTVNDTLGHGAGDAVLCEVASILVRETRDLDVVARVGGDEFVILFEGQTDTEELGRIALRLIECLEKPIIYESHECRISGSIGIVLSIDYEDIDPAAMMADVDRALYKSKRKGRAQHTIFRPQMQTNYKTA
jgi:diguanylate cyclase (GGDEF)-like protein